jgi:hypothetical protein
VRTAVRSARCPQISLMRPESHTWRTSSAVEYERAERPLSSRARVAAYDARVSDTWPPSTPRKRPPTLEHVRDLWTLHGIQSNCTAAIWRNDFGLELRVDNNGELVESRLSRYGEAPLLLIAEQLRANLIAQGWFEVPQATDAR